ncbi:MAG: DUF2147 domain-containing protein, partial [Burkholderiales bacterium]
MRTILRSAAFGAMLAGLLAPAAGVAQSLDTPIGLWKNIDDETKQPKALIRIVEQGGALVGRIEKILTDKADAVCEKCSDDRKGKPVQGMTILTGLKKDGDEWNGGEILDPNNGKVYKAKVKLADAGRKLDVRGFVGIAL